MISIATQTNTIKLPLITGHFAMMQFDLANPDSLPAKFAKIAKDMLKGIKHKGGTAFFTLHGKKLEKGETLRRPGAHTDGNYEPHLMFFGGGGWKVGENGPEINTAMHHHQYDNQKGGLIMVSNFEACQGWLGEFEGTPNKGGDCSHIELDEPFELKRDKVYYGNNHFIHESLPMSGECHRVLARITMPEDHVYLELKK